MRELIGKVVFTIIVFVVTGLFFWVSCILFRGYFVTGNVYGVASGIKDLFGGFFFAVAGAVTLLIGIKMWRL